MSINPTMMDYVKLGMSHYKYTYEHVPPQTALRVCMHVCVLQVQVYIIIHIHPCHTVVYRQSESYSLPKRKG